MPASPDVDVSVGFILVTAGATANTGWTPKIFDVTSPGEEVEAILISSQDISSNNNEYQAADIGDSTDLTVVSYYQADERPVVGADNEAWILTLPDGNTLTFTGFVQSSIPDTHAFNERMMETTIIKISGDVTFNLI